MTMPCPSRLFVTLVSTTAVLLAARTTAFAQTGGRAEVVITTEGLAPGTDLNAREQAKQDALRKAVEQACGTFISAQTRTSNYQAVYDKVMSLAPGYVTEFEILDVQTGEGMTRCKVRATVSKASFEKEWARLLHTIDAEKNPRCMLVVVEDNNTDDENPPKTHGIVQSRLERFFLDKGLLLVDQGAANDMKSRDISLAALNDDVPKLAAAAAALKADVVLKGLAEAKCAGTTEMGGRTLHRWTAVLSIRAYHADSAQLLMSNTYTASKSTVSGNAGDEALLACVDENAGKILREIGEAWQKRQNVRRVCQVTLTDCSREDYKAFEAALVDVTGVQSIRLRELVNNICRVEVEWSFDLERLIRRIEDLKVPGTTYQVTEQTHDRVIFKVSKTIQLQ